MLKIENLKVSAGERRILKGINLTVGEGETHILMGPNACGKTTLVMTVMGFPFYKVEEGRIIFNGEDITSEGIFERAIKGIALAFQNPPEVRGVKLGTLLTLISRKFGYEGRIEEFLNRLKLTPEFIRRDINLGFSGGEKKRTELIQAFIMKPKLMMLDEPDSGVDIDSLKLIGNEIRRAQEELGCSLLVITHHRHIVRYLKPDFCHIMLGGEIVSSGKPEEIIPFIEKFGYKGYIHSFKEGSGKKA